MTRGGLLLIGLVFIAEFILLHGWRPLFRLDGLRAKIDTLPRRGFFLLAGLILLFSWFCLRSAVDADWDSVRRVVMVSLFLFGTAFALLKLRFDVTYLIYFVALLGLVFAAVYSISLVGSEGSFTANPIRSASSGLQWFSSYENTIIAALFWSILFLSQTWVYTQKTRKIITLLCLVASCILLLAIFHTAARTAWVACGFGLFTFFVVSNHFQRRRLLFFLVPTILIAGSYALIRPQAILREGLTYRDIIWKEHVARLQGGADWFFGKGLGALESFVKLPGGQLAVHPHSIYVETLYTGGLMAVGLLLLVQVTVAYCLYDRRISFRGKGFVAAVLVGGSFAMFFDFNGLFDTPNLMWLWLWLPLAVLLAGTLQDGERGDYEDKLQPKEDRLNMQILEHSEYLRLRENGKVIEQDGHGDKVIILPNGTFLKLFRRKRLISSAVLWPYAQRFADNAVKLKALGIPSPEIISVYRVPAIERDAVHYHPLPGLTLRQLYEGQAEYSPDLRNRFFDFVERLHNLGVYFRSIHLGNVILTPHDELGLIDISDMKVYGKSLRPALRKRNYAHIKKSQADWEWLHEIH